MKISQVGYNNLGGLSSKSWIAKDAAIQRVQEAGMQGRLWLPATSTHYDHGAQPNILYCIKIYIYIVLKQSNGKKKTGVFHGTKIT